MPVSINMPQKQQAADPLDKLATAVGVAKAIYGIHADSKQLELAKKKNETDAKIMGEEAEKRGLEIDKLRSEAEREKSGVISGSQRATILKDLVPAKEGEKGAYMIRSMGPDGTPMQEWVKKGAGERNPMTEALAMERMDKMRQEREQRELEKTPKGKLSKMGADQKARFDNVVLGIDAITGMENALAGGSNTFSFFGDNDFTRNERKWEEAIGRMQSGGAISDPEAERFRQMIPGVRDSKEQQAKKLADMREIMEQRFGTFGFDKSQAADLGLNPERMGFVKSDLGGAGKTAGGGAAPQPKTVIQNGHTYTLNPKTGKYE